MHEASRPVMEQQPDQMHAQVDPDPDSTTERKPTQVGKCIGAEAGPGREVRWTGGRLL